MNIKVFNGGFLDENCYLVSGERAAIVIDPGCYDDSITDFLKNNADKARLILLTHCHFDHIGAAKKIADETGVRIAIGRGDARGLTDTKYNLASLFRSYLPPFEADILLDNEQILEIGDLSVRVIFTPGHTTGSVCYLIDGNLFSGDTIFYESYGRTDFPGGDAKALRRSFYFLMTNLSDDVVVYPGHDQSTTIGHELDSNPMGYMGLI